LLHVTDDLDRSFRLGRIGTIANIDGKNLVEFLPRLKITELPPRVENASLAAEVTLLADAIARAGRKSLRVDGVLAAGALQVDGRIACDSGRMR
jgi:hypothetical protein